MINLPISAFPLACKATKSSAFIVAILIGLAIYMATKHKQDVATKK